MSQANPAGAALFSFQWDMRLIGADAAWAAGKLGSSSITVAIIDSGLDYDNRDLTGLVDLSRSKSFVPGDDSLTATYFPTRNVVDDYNGHGTNVGTQVSSKAFAFAGVTSRTTLMAVKVIGWNGAGNVGRSLAGILWAADHGANVANLSLGGLFEKAGAQGLGGFVERVVNYANKKGMLIVAAAGNAGSDMDHDANSFNTYCSAAHVICVSSVGPKIGLLNQDEPSFFTNFGRSAIDVAAPGGNADTAPGAVPSARPWGNDLVSWIWSFCARRSIASLTSAGVPVLAGCQGGGTVLAAIGTSQASPHVAGLAALLMAEGKNAIATRQAILSSADDLGQPGVDPFYGSGRINVRKALGL
jgi:subtilisin family serine protease